MIWPFSYLPNWANFLAIWTGYSILLLTAWVALLAILHWWLGKNYQDEIEEWAEMRRKAQEVRDKINGPS